ncbi:MAG: FMN-binding protein [Dermatophilaceae bacterium]
MNPPDRPDRPRRGDRSPPSAESSHLRRNVVWGMSTLSAVVLALSYHTSLDSRASTAALGSAPAGSAVGAPAAQGSPSGAAASSAAGAGSSTALADGTFTGTSASTRRGNVQVRIVVSGGSITSSQAIAYPDDNERDQQINSQAVPAYNSAAVTAQSADIDSLSGATATWQGYTDSLQSAIDQARA